MNEATEDPFDLLGIEPAFDVDIAHVRSVVRRRIAACHPDRVVDPLQQEEALRESARLNAARAQLEDDEKRANLLLSRLGGPSAEDDQSLPENFLPQMMQVRMEMEEALASGDAEAQARTRDWMRDERTRLWNAVAELFRRLQEGEDVGSQLRCELNVWRYIERMIEQFPAEVPDAGGGR